MGTNDYSMPTMLDLMKNVDAAGNVLTIVETLTRSRDFFKYATYEQCNQILSHLYAQRVSEPVGTLVGINHGSKVEKSVEKQLVENVMMIESYSQLDIRQYNLAKNPQQYRSNKEIAHQNGLTHTFLSKLLYGNPLTEPLAITGIMNRLGKINDVNVIDNGGDDVDSVSSILIISFGREGEGKCYMVYPSTVSTVGIEYQDLDEQRVPDENGGYFQALVGHHKIHGGFVIENEKNIQRIANIATSGTDGVFDPKILLRALDRMENPESAVIFMNKTIATQFKEATMDKTNVQYSVDNPWKIPMASFNGRPIAILDEILNTESVVTE